MADQNGGGNPAGGDPNAGAGGNTSTQTDPNAAGGGQQPVVGQGGSGGQGNEKQFVYREDRTDWIPRSRFNEGQTKLQREIEALKTQLGSHDEFRTKLGQVFGVGEPDADEKAWQEIETLLTSKIPALGKLKGLSPEQVEELFEGVEESRQTTKAQWDRLARTMITNLGNEVAKGMGAQKLTDTQSARLKGAYRDEAQACWAARQRAIRANDDTYDFDNDFIARHERGDESLVQEFAKAFLNDWFEPARRSAQSQQMKRQGRPVPRGERAGQPVSRTPDVDLSDDKKFKEALLAARNGG